MIEFEPTDWASNCRQFLIQTGKSEYWAIDRNGSPEGYPHVYRFDTFSAAVAWCEARKGAGDEVHNDPALD